MKTLVLPAIALGAGLALCSLQAHAMSQGSAALSRASDPSIVNVAHAGAPYTNVDHRNDAGNDTGDSQVDRLNEQSLRRARGQQ